MYDLHSHSIFSDGELSPRDLVALAKDAGVSVLALTDHDTTAGLAQAKVAAKDYGIRLIPGVEISLTWKTKGLHVLGLNIDPTNPTLQAGLEENRLRRIERAKAIAQGLKRAGIKDAYEGVCALAKGEVLGRAHFARYLVAQGHVDKLNKVFKHYMVPGKPGYVAIQWPDLGEGIDWIRAAGGDAVLAHPLKYGLTIPQLRHLLLKFRELGGCGLEVASSHLPHDRVYSLVKLCLIFDLYASLGSDYHGPQTPWTQLGNLPALPEKCKPIWELWKQE